LTTFCWSGTKFRVRSLGDLEGVTPTRNDGRCTNSPCAYPRVICRFVDRASS
jgi:hypothetical protein